jgi:Ricin-type beta-trefoil lectin domain
MTMRGMRRLGLLPVLFLMLAACTAEPPPPAQTGHSPATIPGKPVSPEMFTILVEAAHVCPDLTPARLAGQVMAESSFASDVANGLAGLSDEDWKAWTPSPDADRSDPRASITALARLICDLVGRERAASAAGNLWWLAVSAYRSGKRPTVSADGVASPVRAYADRVAAHAAWYDTQPDFNTFTFDAPPSPAPSPAESASPSSGPPATESPAAPRSRPTTTGPSPAAPPAPAPNLRNGASLFNAEFRGCLSATKSLDGTHLSVAACDGSALQRWTAYTDGTIQAVGLCMDVANAVTADFTPVQVARCSGNAAQQFVLQGDHLRSTYASKCVNIDINSTIVIYRCVNQSNQVWKVQ